MTVGIRTEVVRERFGDERPCDRDVIALHAIVERAAGFARLDEEPEMKPRGQRALARAFEINLKASGRAQDGRRRICAAWKYAIEPKLEVALEKSATRRVVARREV